MLNNTEKLKVTNLTPREIVTELDRYIIGQTEAKKAVAIALRNRWRRSKIEDSSLKKEIMPKNIIMEGPTGVGKTEIARRLAQIAEVPFVKVEATKFTEVGYVGRDVESMVKDLVKNAISMLKQSEIEKVKSKAMILAEQKILDLLNIPNPEKLDSNEEDYEEKKKRQEIYREKHLEKLKNGEYNEKIISISVETKALPVFEITGMGGNDEMDVSIRDMMGNLFPQSEKEKKMTVEEAFEYLVEQEASKMLDMDKIQSEALKWAEENGIIFIDEIDKVIGKGASNGPNVSREGVQRDFLPIVEGSTVNTKYGSIKTDHILFIAAGAFHMVSPSDLIPELQGRFPLTVSLKALTQKDFEQILTEPENSLVKQYQALMATEKIKLEFLKDGIATIAQIAFELNTTTQNIGARRLQMVMERLLENLSFKAPDSKNKKIKINAKYVKQWFTTTQNNEKLNDYII
jgi:ATP-dependent HslUV protease ATP-binding subunit HslU